ncbi:MAG: dephospho-CoA kinase [Flavobacteriaceae bacterium]|nr:dephospho-CoA kinase [Flavobacteriaceae bacterium]
MTTIGITGGIGSGKSKILSFLSNSGFKCYNSDDQAKKLLNTNLNAKKSLINYFGNSVYVKNNLDSKYLSKIVFNNSNKLRKLSSIAHPLVIEDFKKFKKKSKSKIIFLESAILFESNFNLLCDYIVLISAPTDVRIERIIKRDSITYSEVISRISAQWPDRKKIQLADVHIENIDWYKTVLLIENLIADIKKRFFISD